MTCAICDSWHQTQPRLSERIPEVATLCSSPHATPAWAQPRPWSLLTRGETFPDNNTMPGAQRPIDCLRLRFWSDAGLLLPQVGQYAVLVDHKTGDVHSADAALRGRVQTSVDRIRAAMRPVAVEEASP